jgi:hypothetical protein
MGRRLGTDNTADCLNRMRPFIVPQTQPSTISLNQPLYQPTNHNTVHTCARLSALRRRLSRLFPCRPPLLELTTATSGVLPGGSGCQSGGVCVLFIEEVTDRCCKG